MSSPAIYKDRFGIWTRILLLQMCDSSVRCGETYAVRSACCSLTLAAGEFAAAKTTLNLPRAAANQGQARYKEYQEQGRH